jgi:hypothetical protein
MMIVRLILPMSPRTRWLGDWLSGSAGDRSSEAAPAEPGIGRAA